jgi:hypothetical protein
MAIFSLSLHCFLLKLLSQNLGYLSCFPEFGLEQCCLKKTLNQSDAMSPHSLFEDEEKGNFLPGALLAMIQLQWLASVWAGARYA